MHKENKDKNRNLADYPLKSVTRSVNSGTQSDLAYCVKPHRPRGPQGGSGWK